MAGYLRTGPAGGRREPGSRGASLVFRACVSGGGGPWRARRAGALRLLLDLLGPGAEAGRAGRLGAIGNARTPKFLIVIFASENGMGKSK